MIGPNEKGHRANGAPEIQEQNQDLHFANEGDGSKGLATMQAKAARCGCTLHELSDGASLVGRRNCSKAVPCLRAVGNLLRQIGGR